MIRRLTSYIESISKDSAEAVDQFAADFGISTNKPRYTTSLQTGKIIGQRYILRINGHADNAFSGALSGDLISTLPIAVSGLSDHWSAFLYDRHEKKARPLGIFENEAWATVRLHGQDDLFIGHPVTCSNPNVVLQLTQTGDTAWTLEAHNPTGASVRVTLKANRFFDPLAGGKMADKSVKIPAGESLVWKI